MTPSRNRSNLRAAAAVLAVTFGLLVELAHGQNLSINGGAPFGTITTTGPNMFSNGTVGGVSFWANYTLNGGQTTVNPANLRWLQLVTFSKNVNGFPNRPFIDPVNGQNIGGGNTGDNLPWYDITGNTMAGVSAAGRGVGTWMGDGPQAPWTLAPLTFTAETVVVQIIDAPSHVAEILGGDQWGYGITSPGGVNTVTPIAASALTVNQNLINQFNTGLTNDFNGWSVIIPEPSTITLALIAIAGLAATKARRKKGNQAAA